MSGLFFCGRLQLCRTKHGLIVGLISLVSTFVGFRLARRADQEDQQGQIRGILETVSSDITRAVECAEGWRKIATGAPAYRLPVATWNASVTLLAASETLSAAEREKVARLFDLANELNHCFNRIEEVDQSFRSAEEQRAWKKVSHILEPPDRDSVAAQARAAIDAALARLQRA